MKIEVKCGHYPDAGITVLRAPRDQSEGLSKFIVRVECCGRVQKMSRGNVLERLRTGAAYRETKGYAIPCKSCSKGLGMYRSERPKGARGYRKTADYELIFEQIKVPDWPNRPGDVGLKLWSDGCK